MFVVEVVGCGVLGKGGSIYESAPDVTVTVKSDVPDAISVTVDDSSYACDYDTHVADTRDAASDGG